MSYIAIGLLAAIVFLVVIGVRGASRQSRFAEAIRQGDLDHLRQVLAKYPHLASQENIKTATDTGKYGREANAGQLGALRLLVEHAAGDWSARWILGTAANTGALEVVRVLLEAGVDEDLEGALQKAIDWGYTEIAQLLVAHGADVNLSTWDSSSQHRFTPLVWAARKNKEEIVRLLLDAGADPNWETSTGQTALSFATDSGYKEVARTLVEAGADQTTTVSPGGRDNCERCAAGFQWAFTQTKARLQASGTAVVDSSGQAYGGSRPSDFAGDCLKCRDSFCVRHADDGRCSLCGGHLQNYR